MQEQKTDVVVWNHGDLRKWIKVCFVEEEAEEHLYSLRLTLVETNPMGLLHHSLFPLQIMWLLPKIQIQLLWIVTVWVIWKT